MTRALLTLSAFAMCVAASASAQPRADFSGRWTVVPDSVPTGRAGGPPPSMGSGWGNEITLTQDATSLRLEYAFFARSDMQPPHRFVYALDGIETTNTVMLGRGIDELRSKTVWDGDRLVITTTQRIPDPAGSAIRVQTTVVRTLALESPGQLAIVTVRGALYGSSPSTTRTVYRKQ